MMDILSQQLTQQKLAAGADRWAARKLGKWQLHGRQNVGA